MKDNTCSISEEIISVSYELANTVLILDKFVQVKIEFIEAKLLGLSSIDTLMQMIGELEILNMIAVVFDSPKFESICKTLQYNIIEQIKERNNEI